MGRMTVMGGGRYGSGFGKGVAAGGARVVEIIAMCSLVLAAACGSESGGSTSARPGPSSTAPGLSGPLTVFAAASLTEAFDDLQTALKTSNPGLSLRYSFAGSGTLVTQMQQGATADVVATADAVSMKKLTDAGLVGPPLTFARNKLQMLVAPGNPKGIRSLSDLSRTDITLVTEDESVPAGKYSAQALQAADVTVRPMSKEADVKAAVARVTAGEADATVVYVTDVTAAGSRGQGVDIPDAQNVVAEYPIAVVKGAKHEAAATAFVDAVVRGRGQQALAGRGFLPAI